MYLIPKEVKADLQLVKGITMNDVLLGILWLCATSPFYFMVHRSMQLPFIIFDLILMVIILLPSPSSGNLKNWQSYYFWLIADRKRYVRVRTDSTLLKKSEVKENV